MGHIICNTYKLYKDGGGSMKLTLTLFRKLERAGGPYDCEPEMFEMCGPEVEGN